MRTKWTVPVVAAGLLLSAAAWAHLCDDVWRQMDKLVLKPDVTNLIAKPGEKTVFNVLMQHNMDRPIACPVKLIGESPGFDVSVEPAGGFNPVRPGQQYTYKVSLAPKDGKSAGNYPVSFRLMGNDTRRQVRELKSLTLGSSAAGGSSGASAAAPSSTRRRADVAGLREKTAPVIDGDVNEPAWRGPSPLVGFMVDDKTRARRNTLVIPRCDNGNLWLMVTCLGVTPADLAAGDAVVIWLANPDKKNQRVSLRLDSTGALKVDYYLDDASRPINPAEFGIRAAAASSDKGWYAEVQIPAPIVGHDRIEKDQIWLINFARDCKAAPAELSFWSGNAATWQKTDSFGEFRLTP